MAEIELREIALFSEMDDQEVAEIRAIMEEMKFKPGQMIIREGELGDLFYVITSGEVQVTIRDAGGEDVVLQELGPGGFFGELSMLTREPRQARVRAIDNVTVLALERDEFFSFLQKRPSAAIDVLVELGGRLHNMDAILRRTASRNVNVVDEERLTFGQRIADWLPIRWAVGLSSLSRPHCSPSGLASTQLPGSITGTRTHSFC